MSYEVSDIKLYDFLSAAAGDLMGAFGATSVVRSIVGPRGKVGFVRDIMVEVLTSLVGTTTVPEVQVGITSGDTTFGRYRLGSSLSLGYPTGIFLASNELWTGNPPRNLQDFANHVLLDGCGAGGGTSSFTSVGVAGGTYGTVVLPGRIPASGMVITNVVSGTVSSSNWKLTLRDPIPYNLATNQLVNIHGVGGITGGNAGATNYYGAKIASGGASTTANTIEVTGPTFGGTYTSGGTLDFVTQVTMAAGTGGSPAGGGNVRVMIEWIGPNVV